MRDGRLATGLLLAVLVTGCGATTPAPAASGTPDPCPPTCPGTAAPVPTPTGTPPAEGSAAWDALVIASQPGELARGGNDTDASQTGQTFIVTVPAGGRLATHAVCQGRTAVTVTTDPPSDAETQLACTEAAPAEVVVVEPVGQPVARTLTVRVAAPAPARWYVVVSAAGPRPVPDAPPT